MQKSAVQLLLLLVWANIGCGTGQAHRSAGSTSVGFQERVLEETTSEIAQETVQENHNRSWTAEYQEESEEIILASAEEAEASAEEAEVSDESTVSEEDEAPLLAPTEDPLSQQDQEERSFSQLLHDHQQLDLGSDPIIIDEVIDSVHLTYPLLTAAQLQNSVAAGNQLSTWGEFDTKFKALSENGPLGFYETYRQAVGVVQPIYSGGEFFSGYRVGRGNFQPWFLERQTNDGGEFKAGFVLPFLKNRNIDSRRADLWRATFEQQRVRPEVRAQLIMFVRDASIVYWNWVAAGARYEIGRRALKLAEDRNRGIERRVELGDLDPPELKDNQRTISLRESKLIDRIRKLQQAAVKLSLYYRTDNGTPIVPEPRKLGDFPEPTEVFLSQLDGDIELALSQRPELAELDALRRQVNVDLAEGQNDTLPILDASLSGAQDVGAPTSFKKNKSPFQLEANLLMSVPLQRRKGRGKIHASQAKLAQINAKRQFTRNKITTEVQSAFAGLLAAYDRVEKSREAKQLAEYMAEVERRKFELGQTDLLKVFQREQLAIEAADAVVDTLLEYYASRADYTAALAYDRPYLREPPRSTDAPLN